MKPNPTLRSILILSSSALFLGPQAANAATYYWDTNSTAAGLGDTAGTWGSSSFWGSLNQGNPRGVVDGTFSTNNQTITGSDTVYFGLPGLALGSTASTIGIDGGGVTVNRIIFGAGQGSQGVTLSGGGGTITLSNSGASIVANNTGTNTIGAVLAGSAGLVKGGSGTVLLTGANLFTGGVTVSGGGTLQVGNGTSGSLTSQALTFSNGGGVFNVRSADAGSTQAMEALTFSTTGIGDGTVQSTYGTSGNAVLSFSSLVARGAGATGNFVVSGGTNGTTNKIVLTGAATGFLDKGLYFNGSSYAAYDATGYVRGLIYGTDANTAATNTITASNHVQLTTSPAARAGDTLLSLNLSGGGVDYTMNSGSLIVPAILKSGGGAVSTISGGTSVTTASNAELVIRTDTSSDLLTISSDITGFNGGLTKTGAGTLTLSGSNGYTGATRINAGILAISGGSAIADNQTVTLANAAGATFKLNNDETILSVTGGGLSGGNVDVQGNTLTLGGTNTSVTFDGKFIGTSGGGIIKTGTGTLTLSNKNTFAGTITVSAGTLALSYGNDGTSDELVISSGGPISLNNGAVLSLVPNTNLPSGVISGQLQVGKGLTIDNNINVAAGTATLNFTGNDNRFTINGTVSGSSTPATPTTLAIFSGDANDREAITLAGVIQDGSGGALGLNITARAANGGAYINLANSNTFTGAISMTTTRNNAPGYLVIGGVRNSSGITTGNGSLGSGGVYSNTISLTNTGTSLSILNYASSANQTLGGEISGTGQLLKEGAGTLTLSADNTYTGTTTVTTGALIINGSTSTSSIVSVASGATLGGSGTVGGNTTISGNLSPATLTFTNDLTLNANAIYNFEAGDLTQVGQILTLTDNWTLALGAGFQDGGQVLLFTYGSLAASPDLIPTFDTTNLGFTPSASLSLTDNGSGSIFLNGVSVIPEPRALLLGSLGILLFLRRRR